LNPGEEGTIRDTGITVDMDTLADPMGTSADLRVEEDTAADMVKPAVVVMAADTVVVVITVGTVAVTTGS
jgi:hypothetical protein